MTAAEEVAGLRSDVQHLRTTLDGLSRTLDRQVAEKVDSKVAEMTVPREELRRRLRRSGQRGGAALVVLLLLLVVAVGANRLTLQQAQKRQAAYIQTLVRDCSASARLAGSQLAFCRRAIPNFDRSRAAAAQRARDYDALRKWAISRGWTPPKPA